jgi:hypothetical protein
MRKILCASVGAAVAVLAVAWMTSTSIAGQTQAAKPAAPAEKAYTAPRTGDGQPDLQGVWDFRSGTPLERPKEFADKPFLTPQEIADYEKEIARTRNQDRRDQDARGKVNGEETTGDVARAYNDFWWDFGKKVVGTRRTSLIIDPPDGKIPALTDLGKQRAAQRAEERERVALGPEDRGTGERCIMGFNAGPPMLPSAYNNNMQLVQSKDTVVILNEMVHNARVISLNTPHSTIPQWSGDSRGRWEGNTLVVDTVGFHDQTSFPNSNPKMHLVERFTRTAADVLTYEFTVDDPTTWTKPWTAQVPMVKNSEHIYEYACHEGNYGMFGLMSAARATDRERAAQDAAKKGSR